MRRYERVPEDEGEDEGEAQRGKRTFLTWWCPGCRADRGFPADVRLLIVGRLASHVCRRCNTVLEREEFPF